MWKLEELVIGDVFGRKLMIGEAERFTDPLWGTRDLADRGERSRMVVIGRRIISGVFRNNSELPLLE